MTLISVAVFSLYCGSRFVKKEEVHRISKDYEKVYVLKERIDIGNFDSLNKGAKIRVYFKTTGEYISVYAYPYSQPREEAQGKCILQIFESEFPDKKFKEELLRQRVDALIEEFKGKLDPRGGTSFDSELERGKAPPPSRGGGGGGGRGGRGRRGR